MSAMKGLQNKDLFWQHDVPSIFILAFYDVHNKITLDRTDASAVLTLQ